MSYKDPNRCKEYSKAYRQEHKEEAKAYMKAWRQANKEQHNAYQKADVNANGQTKNSIRCKSCRYLRKSGMKRDGYEIHHCFGYEDPSKFIYCSKELHLKIHKYLREHNIDANSDHWMAIRELVNDTDEFWYIKC